jgi:DNA-3-methyladenine glycosylase
MIGAEDNPVKPLPPDFYRRDTARVARDLLGCRLVRRFPDGRRRSVVIVEAEAYLGVRDRAGHTWNGRRTPRVAPMWGPGGHAYVYFVYGMHHCLNVVTKNEGEPEAVLIRAAVPQDTWDLSFAHAAAADTAADIRKGAPRRAGVKGALRAPRSGPGPLPAPPRRPRARPRASAKPEKEFAVASGPAKVCTYLGITTRLSGASLAGPVLFLFSPSEDFLSLRLPLLAGPRVGVGYAGEAAAWPLRFAVAGCAAVTRPGGLLPIARTSSGLRARRR